MLHAIKAFLSNLFCTYYGERKAFTLDQEPYGTLSECFAEEVQRAFWKALPALLCIVLFWLLALIVLQLN